MLQEVQSSLRHLTDEDLVERVKGLAARERGATALLVAHLAELDTRDVHLNLREVQHEHLPLSADYRRIGVPHATICQGQ
jgi:hypothetical protein